MNKLKLFLFCVLLFKLVCASLHAEIYGGGYWETIGIGNMPCEVLLSNSQNTDYKEVISVWVSGFLTGVNYTSHDVYDITNGEDIYMLTDALIVKCEKHPDKTLSDLVTEVVYSRYHGNEFVPAKDVNK